MDIRRTSFNILSFSDFASQLINISSPSYPVHARSHSESNSESKCLISLRPSTPQSMQDCPLAKASIDKTTSPSIANIITISSQAQARPKQRCRFLELPAELRVLIYNLVLICSAPLWWQGTHSLHMHIRLALLTLRRCALQSRCTPCKSRQDV